MEKVSFLEVPDDGICKMPISPCGMAVDISGHTRTITVRPFRNSDITTKIKFYIVPEDTPFIPFATCFTDPDHLQHRDIFDEAGWVGDERYKNHKSKPLPIRLTGEYCGPGDPEVWEQGGIHGVHEPLPTILNYPICCLPGDLQYFDGTPNVVVSSDHEDEVISANVGNVSVVVEAIHEDDVAYILTGMSEIVASADHIDNVVYVVSGNAEVVVEAGSGTEGDDILLHEVGSVEIVASVEHEDSVVPNGLGVCAGDTGHYGSWELTVTGATDHTELNGTFTLTYFGSSGPSHLWTMEDLIEVSDPPGGNMGYIIEFLSDTGCYRLKYGGICGPLDTWGNVTSLAPVTMEFMGARTNCSDDVIDAVAVAL